MGQRWLDGYSAEVEIYLVVDGRRYDVAQIGKGKILLRDTHSIRDSTSATLVIKIDGVEEVEHVLLGVNKEDALSFF